eukprot:403354325
MESSTSSQQSAHFSKLIEEEKQQTRNRKIAASINDSIEQLESEPHAVVRWVWELVQNAQDAANPGQKVQIRIILEHDKLIFSHTGKPFNLNDILNLIEQGSKKDRPKRQNQDDLTQKAPQETPTPIDPQTSILEYLTIPTTTGRFGTGFLTTYLLSKNVEVQGVFHHIDQQSNESTFRKFSLLLNRDAKDLDHMIELNQQSAKIFQELDDTNICPIVPDYEPGLGYDTQFVYHIDEEGYKNACEGFYSLSTASPYVLAFNEKIQTFHLVDIQERDLNGNVTQQGEVLLMLNNIPKFSVTDIKILHYIYRQLGEPDIDRYFIQSQGRYSQIVAEVKILDEKLDRYEFLAKDPSIPNFFVDYPLIGSESLGTGVVFNSHAFYPNEKRSGIQLVKGKKAAVNREIMTDCKENFEQFLNFVIEQKYSGLQNLIMKLNPQQQVNDYLKEILLDQVIKIFLNREVIESELGFIILDDAIFPWIDEKQRSLNFNQQLEDLWDLANYQYGKSGLLIKKNVNYIMDWAQVYDDKDWKNHLKQKNLVKLDDILIYISSFKTLKELKYELELPNIQGTIDYLNKVYKYLKVYCQNEQELKTILKTYKIFPNQEENGDLCYLIELYQDINIDEKYKNIFEVNNCNLRKHLLHKDIQLEFDRMVEIFSFQLLEEIVCNSVNKHYQNIKINLKGRGGGLYGGSVHQQRSIGLNGMPLAAFGQPQGIQQVANSLLNDEPKKPELELQFANFDSLFNLALQLICFTPKKVIPFKNNAKDQRKPSLIDYPESNPFVQQHLQNKQQVQEEEKKSSISAFGQLGQAPKSVIIPQVQNRLSLDQQRNSLLELIDKTIYSAQVKPIYSDNIPSKTFELGQQIILLKFRKQIRSFTQMSQLSQSLVKQIQPLEFLKLFYGQCKDILRLQSQKSIISKKIVPNQNGYFSFTNNLGIQYKVKFNQIYECKQAQQQVNELIKALFEKYLTLSNQQAQVFNQDIVHSDLNTLLFQHAGITFYDVFTLKDLTTYVDDKIVTIENSRDRHENSKQSIDLLEKCYNKLVTHPCKPEYFPKYHLQRKNIQVNLRMTDPLTNDIFEIMENQQQDQLHQLCKICPDSYDFISKLLVLMYDNKPQNELIQLLKICMDCNLQDDEIKHLGSLIKQEKDSKKQEEEKENSNYQQSQDKPSNQNQLQQTLK